MNYRLLLYCFAFSTLLVTDLAAEKDATETLRVFGPIAQWCADPTTTITLIWISNEVKPAQFHVKTRPTNSDAFWQDFSTTVKPFADTELTLWHCNISGLTPNTRYEFQLYHGETIVRQAFFQTAPADNSLPIRFIAGGDLYYFQRNIDKDILRDPFRRMSRIAGRQSPLFALLGGDYTYDNNKLSYRWISFFNDWLEYASHDDGTLTPIITAIGNHEVGTSKEEIMPPAAASIYFSIFHQDGGPSNYAIDFGDYLCVILLDSELTQSIASQTPWLDRSLTARADFDYILPVYHDPAYGTGVKPDQLLIRQHWSPLFEKHHITAALENDHHVYKRTHPITAGTRDDRHGITYIGDGAWSVPVRTPEAAHITTLPYIARWGARNHFFHITLTPERAYFRAVDIQGDTFDEFAIATRKKPPPHPIHHHPSTPLNLPKSPPSPANSAPPITPPKTSP